MCDWEISNCTGDIFQLVQEFYFVPLVFFCALELLSRCSVFDTYNVRQLWHEYVQHHISITFFIILFYKFIIRSRLELMFDQKVIKWCPMTNFSTKTHICIFFLCWKLNIRLFVIITTTKKILLYVSLLSDTLVYEYMWPHHGMLQIWDRKYPNAVTHFHCRLLAFPLQLIFVCDTCTIHQMETNVFII